MKTLQYPFGEIKVFRNYVIAVMKDGITVIPEFNEDLVEISKTYFKSRPFGYITHRINSYGVNPLVYLETYKIENLAAFAVVTTKENQISNIKIEKIFMKFPFRHFTSLADAKNWVNSMVEKK